MPIYSRPESYKAYQWLLADHVFNSVQIRITILSVWLNVFPNILIKWYDKCVNFVKQVLLKNILSSINVALQKKKIVDEHSVATQL